MGPGAQPTRLLANDRFIPFEYHQKMTVGAAWFSMDRWFPLRYEVCSTCPLIWVVSFIISPFLLLFQLYPHTTVIIFHFIHIIILGLPSLFLVEEIFVSLLVSSCLRFNERLDQTCQLLKLFPLIVFPLKRTHNRWISSHSTFTQ